MRRRVRRRKRNPIIGYVAIDKNYRVIGPRGSKIDSAFGSKERALEAMERYGRGEEVMSVEALHLGGILSVVFDDVGDIMLDGVGAKRLEKGARGAGLQVYSDEIEEGEREAVYSSRALLGG